MPVWAYILVCVTVAALTAAGLKAFYDYRDREEYYTIFRVPALDEIEAYLHDIQEREDGEEDGPEGDREQ